MPKTTKHLFMKNTNELIVVGQKYASPDDLVTVLHINHKHKDLVVQHTDGGNSNYYANIIGADWKKPVDFAYKKSGKEYELIWYNTNKKEYQSFEKPFFIKSGKDFDEGLKAKLDLDMKASKSNMSEDKKDGKVLEIVANSKKKKDKKKEAVDSITTDHVARKIKMSFEIKTLDSHKKIDIEQLFKQFFAHVFTANQNTSSLLGDGNSDNPFGVLSETELADIPIKIKVGKKEKTKQSRKYMVSFSLLDDKE